VFVKHVLANQGVHNLIGLLGVVQDAETAVRA
jgi:hypothetical protein